MTVHFLQPCPTCGRRLRILVEYLGLQVACRQCGHIFVARDVSQRDGQETTDDSGLLDRVDRLLGSPDPPS